MRKIYRSNQIGAVGLFALVCIVLVLVLGMSVYSVKTRGDVARKEQAIAIYEKQKQQKNETAKNNEDVAASNSESLNKSTNSLNNQSIKDNPNSADTSSKANSSDLPDTGPNLAWNQILGAGFVVAIFFAYFLSRQDLARIMSR